MAIKKKKETPVIKIATFIVDKRKGFFLFFIIAAIFCLFSMTWVKVNNDLTDYLPDTSETRVGLTLMDQEFVTYGSGSIMVDNITYSSAEKLAADLERIE